MFNFATSLRIFLCLEAVDMRKAFNGLYAIAKHELEQNPMDGSLFVFANRRRDRIKILYFDGSGFWILAKRLEKGTFWWPSPGMSEGRQLEIRHEALAMLLNGIDLKGGSLRPWFGR